MKQQLINISKAAVLAVAIFAAGTLASCSDEHEGMGGAGTEGSIPLVLGEVSVDTPATASTRAAVTENGTTGYTGIRKSRFVSGDVLTLTLKDGDAVSETVTATLTGGKWALDKQVYVTAATNLTATYTAAQQVTGITADNLTASTFTLADRKLNIAMLHAGAMIDITVPGDTKPTSVGVTAGDAAYTTAVEEDDKGAIHYRAIVPAGKVTAVTAVVNGINFVAKVSTLTAAANKRYPVKLAFKSIEMTATAGAGESWATGGDILSGGYTRVIATAEDLAQFAKEVNDDTDGTGARIAKVIQVADIDLGTLKSSPNYTATADNWVPIGNHLNFRFNGTYNGNGHTIGNLKFSTISWNYTGLFGCVKDGTLVGIHLRNCELASISLAHTGALAGYLIDTHVSLCSATGSVTTTGKGIFIGGFVGSVEHSSISRCSADVDVSHTTNDKSPATGSFIGNASTSSVIAGCQSSGNVTLASTGGAVAGFIGKCHEASIVGCCFNGSLEGTDTRPAFLNLSSNTSTVKITSCYATAKGKDFVLAADNSTSDTWSNSKFTDCAWTSTTTLGGVTGELTANNISAALTATDAPQAGVKTCHWNAADGYTTDSFVRTWYPSLIWKSSSTVEPTIDLSYEGGGPLYDGQPSNLLSVPGKTPYWIAPVDAATGIKWGDVNFTTICPDGWKAPSKDEFVAMTRLNAGVGWQTNDYAAIAAAFPSGFSYWSSTESEDSKAWVLAVEGKDQTLNFANTGKSNTYRVRCVKKK